MVINGLIWIVVLLSWVRAEGEVVKFISYPTNLWWQSEVRVHVPATDASGILVFLPSGGINSFADSPFPKMLATNGVVTLIATPKKDGLYTGDEILAELSSIISDLKAKHKIEKVAIGGFSSGGIGAVRYAQYCIKKKEANTPVAVFAVDSPLDYERWYVAAELHLARLRLAGRELNEDRNATNELGRAFGGSPDQVREKYRQQSPVTVLVPDGGNAKLLRETPVRVYIEPAVKWRLENWNREAYCFNLVDSTALINVLKLLGNKDAELITTVEKGFRPGAIRNPHSWSIVDEVDLVRWLRKYLR